MNAIKKLQIVTPPISAFSHQVYILAILMSHEESLDWVYSNYIQLFTLTDLYNRGTRIGTGDFFYNYFGDWQELEVKTCPWISYQEIPFKLVFTHTDIHDFLKQTINFEFYVKICIDTYYIELYGNIDGHFNHQILINGYDDKKQVYYVSDNFAQGKFDFVEVPYDSMYNAINAVINEDLNCDDYQEQIILMKFRKCRDLYPEIFGLNISKIINDINEYMLQDGYGKVYRDISQNYAFGLDYYEELCKY